MPATCFLLWINFFWIGSNLFSRLYFIADYDFQRIVLGVAIVAYLDFCTVGIFAPVASETALENFEIWILAEDEIILCQ